MQQKVERYLIFVFILENLSMIVLCDFKKD